MTSNQRWPPIKDDLKLLKVEYLNNPCMNLPQIFNLCLWDQTKIENCLIWRQPPMEEDLKISKLEYLSNQWLDLTQILNLSFVETNIENSLKWRQHPMEDDLKISKVKYISNHWNESRGPNLNWILLEMKRTFNWRQPQNIKVGISQQHMNGSSSTVELSLGDQTKIENCLKWRWPPM